MRQHRFDIPETQMISSADSYLESALHLEEAWHQKPNIFRSACVLAALSVEIYLKSFIAEDKSRLVDVINGVQIYGGGVGTKRIHGLTQLFDAIPKGWQDKILAQSHDQNPNVDLVATLNHYSDFFVEARYEHEPGAKGYLSDDILRLAEHVKGICHALAQS
ncbi:hypothetical protein QEP73_11840 [Pseudomonas defluvii]|nr:hypothetical protein QEP73_11840 [Pseudomonas defluvii]